jgi:hypothetical protein
MRLTDTVTVRAGSRTVTYSVPSAGYDTRKNLRLAFCRGFHARTDDFYHSNRANEHSHGYRSQSSKLAFSRGYAAAEAQEAL